MGKAKGVPAPQHTEEQKIALSEKVCELYETQNATLESCCEAVGISDGSFYLWCSKIGQIGERYKKAKQKNEDHYFEERLKPKLMTAMERLITDMDEEKAVTEELAHQGLKTGDTRTIITKTRREANPTAVIFGMKGVFPDKFAERTKTETTLTLVNGAEMTPEQVDAAIDAALIAARSEASKEGKP